MPFFQNPGHPLYFLTRAALAALAISSLVISVLGVAGSLTPLAAQETEPDTSRWFPRERLVPGPLADPLEPGFRGAAVRSDLLRGGLPDAERRLPRVEGLSPDGEDWQGIVSLGETLPIRTIVNRASAQGGVLGAQLGILVGVTARFRLATGRNEYVASDWVVGLPLEVVRDQWDARVLLYHRSAHLGDEIMEDAGVRRVGYGHEGMQLLVGRVLASGSARVYAGGSHLFRSETTGTLAELGRPERDRWEIQGGIERGQPEPHRTSGLRTVLALDVKSSERTQWQPQWSALAGVAFQARSREGMLALRWLHGPAIHGEFFLRPESALGLEFRLTP
jgi:hypothetical protein